ncbi:Anti-sigma regulatory factor (Ser/Thr protein kinase) [Blastococcus aggregatus]|uniref:Anti-sigma regulatory factor (Ser/Thr protein kinase) n=1 Tax=Blastococcus aggregatus TaxID=38502 RepID=A0A285V6Q9_9ACTN|nr:sensor histidine kinase [Blastococcus aggregatus]SOC49740.1 Anti-sigma regulatory factor (Ser/Thr protein kinase) [Blastococcus aggregatus]
MTPPATTARASAGFEHEALFYRDDESFLAGLVPFVREGLSRGEDVVVAEPPGRLELLRDALGPDSAAVRWLDMAALGRNPARIIGAWSEALEAATAAGTGLRGVGEPAWPGRHDAEFVECRLHELLLGTAFDDGPAWRLLCPYDQTHLPRAVRTGALQSHPVLSTPGHRRPSTAYSRDAAAATFAAPLQQPTEGVLRGSFGVDDVRATRRTVASFGRSCGLSDGQVEALELAASELVVNSVRHGGGSGTLALWDTDEAAVVEFSDGGHIEDPLVGRRRPPAHRADGGHGIYLVNQLCDLVQLRSSPHGTAVRITTWR